jgi:hypothetical protein
VSIKCKQFLFIAGSVFLKVFGNGRYASVQEYGCMEVTLFCTKNIDKADVFEIANTM